MSDVAIVSHIHKPIAHMTGKILSELILILYTTAMPKLVSCQVNLVTSPSPSPQPLVTPLSSHLRDLPSCFLSCLPTYVFVCLRMYFFVYVFVCMSCVVCLAKYFVLYQSVANKVHFISFQRFVGSANFCYVWSVYNKTTACQVKISIIHKLKVNLVLSLE